MAAHLLPILQAKDYVERAKSPKYLEIILQEHLNIISTPIRGTCDIFNVPKNKGKNRCQDYPCWDISRVVLKSCVGTDYINANYVSGFDGRCKFIATQEPIATTYNDFWTMVWQENSRIIVMLNGVKQKSQPTSLPYIRDNQDHIILKEFIIKEESFRMKSNYTYTSLSIVHKQSRKSKTIHHFKYLDWLELGASDVKSFLDFLLVVNNQDQYYFKQALLTNQSLPGPIIVHSEKGIGRTAAYCVADICLYQLIHTGAVSVPSTVLQVRQQRSCSIPISNLYIFINNVILYFLITIKSNIKMLLNFRSHLGMTEAHLLSLGYKPQM